MRCFAISLALLLSTLTVAHASRCGTLTQPTSDCPCVGSGCKGRYCCLAFVGGSEVGNGFFSLGRAAACYPTFDYSKGWNRFCPGSGFVFGTGSSHR